MATDKGTLIIKLTATTDGKTAITACGRRRGMPTQGAKLVKLLREYRDVWAECWGYSSVQFVGDDASKADNI